MSPLLDHMELPSPYTWLEYGFLHCFPCRKKRKREKGSPAGKTQFISRVEKEYLKPSYSASVGEELEDGLFDGNVETHVISLCSRISCITPFFI